MAFCLLLTTFLQWGRAETILPEAEVLVDVSTVAEWVKEQPANIILIEVSKAEVYAAGHIPGARNTWRKDYQSDAWPYSGIIAEKPQMEALLGRLGVSGGDLIVLYDERGNVNAARLWWILRRYGHYDVRILAGGKQAWTTAGHALSTEAPEFSATAFRFSQSQNDDLYADKAMVQAALDDPNSIVLDVRTQDEYSGAVQKPGASRAGHIPGSILLNYTESLVYADGEPAGLKSKTELTELFASNGITRDKNIIVYCHSGMRSSLTTFVLWEVLDYPNVKNYDGSWVEWSHDQAMPIDTGLPVLQAAVATADEGNPNPKKGILHTVRQSYKNYWNYLVSEVTFNYDYKPKWQNFFWGLILLSLFFYSLELLWPWRKHQARIRKDFWLDAFYMFFNVFLFGLIIFFALENVLTEGFNELLGLFGLTNIVAVQVHTFPVWAYYIILFLVADFIQWNIHRLLHRVPFLWEFHKVHHSVEQMGFAAHLRFHWMENVVYKGIQAIPLTMLGYNLADLFLLHIFNLAWGHFNHSNITVSGRIKGTVFGGLVAWGLASLYIEGLLPTLGVVAGGMAFGGVVLGPVMKYIFNSPEMHIWHHAWDLPKDRRYGVNFGLTLAIWDYIWGTAYIPHDGRDIRLGFPDLDKFPKSFLQQLTYGIVKHKT